jgi:oxepin-CoA hydrolase / 3-oxo-5,6-dehydrosuberyl-CoA semialdehyde dehydrogenase
MRVMKSTLSAISLYAAGLFVDPPPGSVLANYGLDSLRFVKPVEPGDQGPPDVKEKYPRSDKLGEVIWDAEVTTVTGETVASYHQHDMRASQHARIASVSGP